jgi:hypothetical protein
VEVVQYRETEKTERIIADLIKGADWAWLVDCADKHATFVVSGWFVIPKGASLKSPTVSLGA